MVKMKLLIYVLTTTNFLFSVNFSLSHAWASDGDDSGTLLCDKNKVMELKEAVNKCKQLAYLNFLEEKLANVNDFKARCDYLDYEVSTYLPTWFKTMKSNFYTLLAIAASI